MSLGNARLVPDFPGRPLSATAGCYFCAGIRKHNDPGVVDTGHNVHMEGRVYVCVQCVEWLGSLVGLLDRATARELSESNERLSASNRSFGSSLRAADRRAEAAEDAVEALRAEIKVLKAQRKS